MVFIVTLRRNYVVHPATLMINLFVAVMYKSYSAVNQFRRVEIARICNALNPVRLDGVLIKTITLDLQ